MQTGLQRIDLLLQREVRRWQLAGQDPGDVFRGLYVSDAQANGLLSRPPFLTWGQAVSLPVEDERAWERKLFQAENALRELEQSASAAGSPTCLAQLAGAFQLDQFEVDALLICLAPCLDLRYERLYGYLQDDLTRKRASVSLVLDLLCPPGGEKLLKLDRFSTSAPLVRHHLLEFLPDQGPAKQPLLSCSLTVNETVFAWLLDRYQPGSELAGHSALTFPEEDPGGGLLAGAALQEFQQVLSPSASAVFVFTGPDEAAQAATARGLARRTGKPLLAVDLDEAVEEGSPALPVVQLALRDARLFGAIPYLRGWDVLLQDGRTPRPILRELCSFPGSLVVAGREAWIASGVQRERKFYWHAFPIPDFHRRKALWAHFLGCPNPAQDSRTLDLLAGQFSLSTGQIRDAVATARDSSAPRPGSAEPFTAAELFSAARTHSNPGLARLARKLTPRYGWNDIILPADALAQLREIVAAVRGRPKVLDEWDLGRKLVSSRGVTVLFSGQSGTGKTMAGEIIARELALDLYKIDLSTVVSKYIGETEKNMERIFSEAESSNAILFFDEADALFGKRSEVKDSHDRYANIEISYLLQRMEAYDGITILATNLRANLDEAFTRRLQYTIDFPFPEEADRLRIWQALFPASLPHAPGLDLPMLARSFKLPGGSIRNILVSAAYLAAADGNQVTMDHLLHGARRELQKMGKLIEG